MNSEDDVKVIDKTTAFKGYVRVDRYRLRHRLYAGGWSGEVVREVMERGHAVGVVLYDPALDKLVLIEQFRPGAFARGQGSPWLVEIVAGIVEEGENAHEVARREAEEEAGCKVHGLLPLCSFMTTPGISTESVEVLVGKVDASTACGIHGLDHEDEDIRVIAVSSEEAYRWLDENRVDNAIGMIGLQWFRMRRDELLAAWERGEGD